MISSTRCFPATNNRGVQIMIDLDNSCETRF